jgi:large subunit ribosomal protein L3
MAKQVGMTQVFDDAGNQVPVTVLRVDPNVVVALKTGEKDGYAAVILGVDDLKEKKGTKPCKGKRISKPYKGQFPESITPKRRIREFRDFEKDVAVGDSLDAGLFEGVRYVDVTGISKGKGFQGVVKRWGFHGGRHTHGSKFHREPGSTGQSTYPGKTFKNVKLPGRMGRERVTVLSLRVVKVDTEKQLLMVNGAVPGINKGLVTVRAAVKR